MDGPFGSYAAFLAVALTTHAIVGYTLGDRLFERPWAGTAGALVADVDLVFPASVGWPVVHRGITHTLLVAAVATVAVLSYRRTAGGAVGVGYASHLLVDSTTPKGVPVLYPLVEHHVYLDLPTTAHSLVLTVVLWAGCVLVLRRARSVPGTTGERGRGTG